MRTMSEGNGPQAYARSCSQLEKEGGRHRGNGTQRNRNGLLNHSRPSHNILLAKKLNNQKLAFVREENLILIWTLSYKDGKQTETRRPGNEIYCTSHDS